MRSITSLSVAIVMATLPWLHAEEPVTLQFADTPMAAIVSQVAKLSGERILHPMRPDEATAWAAATGTYSGQVPAADLVATCNEILGQANFTLVPAGDERMRIWCVVSADRAPAGRAPGAGVPPVEGPSVPMDFQQTDLRLILEATADLSGSIISFDAEVLSSAGTCTMNCPEAVPLSAVIPALQVILEQAGLALVVVSAPGGEFRILKVIRAEALQLEDDLARRRALVLGVTPRPTSSVGDGEAPWVPRESDRDSFAALAASLDDEVDLRAWYDPRSRTLTGVQIRSKVPSPRFTRYGLRNRDVLTTVGGDPVTSASQIGELMAAHKDDETVVIEVLRQNRPMELTYRLGTDDGQPGGSSGQDDDGQPGAESAPAPGRYPVTQPIAENTWEIGADDYDRVLRNLADYLDEVNLRPYYDPRSRRLQGLQLRSKVATPVFSKFGLRNRDVLTMVGGDPLTSAGQVMELIKAHKYDETVAVELLRQSQPMTLTYHLREPGSQPGSESSPDAGGFPVRRQSVPMDFNGVQASFVIEAVGSLLGATFIARDDLDLEALRAGKVHLRAATEVPAEHVLLVLQVLMEQLGCSLAPVRMVFGHRAYAIEPVEQLVPRLSPVAPVSPATPLTPAAADDETDVPGTIRIELPDTAKVGDRFNATITIESGIRYLAAYGVEFKWDPAVLKVDHVGAGGGEFDAPFVIHIDEERGELRFNGISVQPRAKGRVPVANLQVTALAKPESGRATIEELSLNQTVAVYDEDGTTPVVIGDPIVVPATIVIE